VSIINDNKVNSEEILTSIKKGNKAFFINKKTASIKARWETIQNNIYIYPL
jgi:hypothetical protein